MLIKILFCRLSLCQRPNTAVNDKPPGFYSSPSMNMSVQHEAKISSFIFPIIIFSANIIISRLLISQFNSLLADLRFLACVWVSREEEKFCC